MITLNIVGSGNVAYHLIEEILNHDELKINQVYARDLNRLPSEWAKKLTICQDIGQLKIADITLISVSDHAINEVSTNLPFDNQLVAHTSGTTALTALSTRNRRSVFYPLQTFSKDKAVDFSNLPICLEAENSNDLATLQKLAQLLSNTVHLIDSEQRKAIHVAAVFVNNFTNHLYTIAEDICREHAVPDKILQPLLQETIAKLEKLTPKEAQTGPAVRFDQETIDAHIALINNELTKEIYQKLTQSIQSYHGRKL